MMLFRGGGGLDEFTLTVHCTHTDTQCTVNTHTHTHANTITHMLTHIQQQKNTLTHIHDDDYITQY